jgi:hypothetical protein
MKRRGFRKLRLNRETLGSLSTGKLGRVPGGVYPPGSGVVSACHYECQESATCGTSGIPGGTCETDPCTIGQNCYACHYTSLG